MLLLFWGELLFKPRAQLSKTSSLAMEETSEIQLKFVLMFKKNNYNNNLVIQKLKFKNNTTVYFNN